MSEIRLWIHIGLPKTGTSAIQTAFGQARSRLLETGFNYPLTGQFGGGHARLAWPMLSADRQNQPDVLERLSPLELRQLWDELDEELGSSECHAALLSTEYLSEASPAAVAEYARRLTPDVRVIVYLRRQDELIESGYNQSVKAGLTDAPFHAPGYVTAYDYALKLAEWSQAFGRNNMEVRLYDARVARTGVVQDLAQVLGVNMPDQNPKSTDLENPSLHASLVDLQRIVNAVNARDSDLVETLQQSVDSLTVGETRRFLTDKERSYILEMYESSNAEVARLYFGAEDGVLFRAAGSDAPPATRDVSVELLAAAIALLWKSSSQRIDELCGQIRELRRQLEDSRGG